MFSAAREEHRKINNGFYANPRSLFHAFDNIPAFSSKINNWEKDPKWHSGNSVSDLEIAIF